MSLQVYNPAGGTGATYPDGSNLVNNLSGRQGEQLGADLHGKWFNANLRRGLYSFVVGNGTIPGIGIGATNAAAVTFALQNPSGSGVNAEIVSTTLSHDSATTVAGSVGWYTLTATSAQSATAVLPVFATKGVAGTNWFSQRVGDTPSSVVSPFTSVTWTTTGGGLVYVKIDTIGTFGATTDATLNIADKQYEGRLILPPGQTIYLGTTSIGLSAGAAVTWAEWPFA